MNKTIISFCKSLAVMAAFFGGSMTASADTVTEGFDTFKAGWNSGWTAYEVTVPEGWDYSGTTNQFAAGETFHTAAPSVEVSGSNTDTYLITPTLKGDFNFYIRNYTKSYQASVKAYACTFEGGTLTLGTELGSKTLAKTSSGVPAWENITFNAPNATRVALLISKAYFDDFTYTPAEGEGGGEGGGGGGTQPDPEPDPVPVMVVTTTAVNFGAVTADATQDVTISNTGNAELTVLVVSDNESFTVSPANLTVAAGASATFAITYHYQSEAYGTHTATITLTPNAGEAATISVSAAVKNPNAWTEDFSGNTLPEGWTADDNWTFRDGVAHSTYAYGTKNYLTTPALLVSGTTDQLQFQARATGIYPDIIIQKSLNGGDWTDYKKIKSDDLPEAWTTFTIDGLEAGTYRFRFQNDGYDLDDFAGFKLDQDAPEMQFTAEDFAAGKVTEAVSKTYTVSNSGTGTLTVLVASDNEQFVVAPTQLEMTTEAKEFTVTFTPQEGVYGKFEANITVTPTYNETMAVTFKASAQVVDPDVWSEDFEGKQLPEGWNIVGTASKWTFADGEASATYEPGGWLVTPKLTVETGKELTFQARSKQYGTDLIVQSQKDGGEWTEVLTKAYEGQTDYETFTIEGLEAGTYRFRIATENLALDNFEGFKLAASTATKETWHISYSFHYLDNSSNEQVDNAVEDMEVEFDGDELGFNFPNPINGNTWMRGAKYDYDGPTAYVFSNGQYIGKYGSEDVYYCGSNGNALCDMVFYYDAEQQAFFNFEHILINGSATAVSYWGYFTDVVIYKDQMPVVTSIQKIPGEGFRVQGSTAIYDLQGRQMNSQFSILNSQLPKGLYIINGKKVLVNK